jgi:hypothetical protein
VPPSEKAAYHTVTGAGRAKVKREFIGLSPRDEDAIVTRLSQHLERVIR